MNSRLRPLLCSATAALCLPLPALALVEVGGSDFVMLHFDTSLASLNLTGGPFPMPLASDPGNALGDSVEGFGFVNSLVQVTLASQRLVSPGMPTLGEAWAFNQDRLASSVDGTPPDLAPIDPAALDGQTFHVNSFFDVWFDITVTDVDSRPGRDFAGMPDGASFSLPDNGPANMQSNYEAIFHQDAPSYGLVPPPEVAPYIGHFLLEIPLGGDINGNGENDKIKFTLATHAVGDTGRTGIFDPTTGTWIDTFDSAAFLSGFVVDLSTDPPFTIGAIDPLTGLPIPGSFGGPTTGTSHLSNSVVPEPGTYACGLLVGVGALGFYLRGRHSR